MICTSARLKKVFKAGNIKSTVPLIGHADAQGDKNFEKTARKEK